MVNIHLLIIIIIDFIANFQSAPSYSLLSSSLSPPPSPPQSPPPSRPPIFCFFWSISLKGFADSQQKKKPDTGSNTKTSSIPLETSGILCQSFDGKRIRGRFYDLRATAVRCNPADWHWTCAGLLGKIALQQVTTSSLLSFLLGRISLKSS